MGSNLSSVTELCPWARHINPCWVQVLVQPRKTSPDIAEKLLTGKWRIKQIMRRWISCSPYKPLSVQLAKLLWCRSTKIHTTPGHTQLPTKRYGRCFKNTGCLPKICRQTVQIQIRLILKEQSDQGLPYLLLILTRILRIPALITNILFENRKRRVQKLRTFIVII